MRILSAISLIFMLAMSPSTMACTQAEAIDSMRALSQAQTERLRGTPAQQQTAARMAIEVSQVGVMLRDAKYDEACASYEAIAAKFGIDLDRYRQKLAPLPSAPGEQCDTITATRKVNEAYRQFQLGVDTTGMTPVEIQQLHRQFSDQIGEATLYVQTEPQRTCTMVDKTLRDYGVSVQ